MEEEESSGRVPYPDHEVPLPVPLHLQQEDVQLLHHCWTSHRSALVLHSGLVMKHQLSSRSRSKIKLILYCDWRLNFKTHISDLAMLQEEEGEWDFCDVGCPVEAGCPNGWNKLQSGCYQVNHQWSLIIKLSLTVCVQWVVLCVTTNTCGAVCRTLLCLAGWRARLLPRLSVLSPADFLLTPVLSITSCTSHVKRWT